MLDEKAACYIEQLKSQLSGLGYSSFQITNIISDIMTELEMERWDAEGCDLFIHKLERHVQFAWKCLDLLDDPVAKTPK